MFVRVEAGDWSATGSGFVVAGDDKALLVATNDHVASARPPGAGKPVTVTVVFDSGTKAERTFAAQIAAADPEHDLAVLRVTGVKTPPRPVPYAAPPKPVETMAVYSFGFPFGKALAGETGSPAVTVGKASVSSLRNGADGELAAVQIDGNLNPGNSGGPIVDAKGRLVGVAVATLRDGQGIGFAVPAQELVRLMQGRLGRVRVSSRKGTSGGTVVRVEVDMLDPTGAIRGVSARYVLVPPKGKQPDAETLDKVPGSKALELKIDKRVAAAEFAAPSEGMVLVQVAAAGKAGPPGRVRAFPLTVLKPADLAGPPLPGWKEYRPRDDTFAVWVPEKPDAQADEERNVTIDEQRVRVNTVVGRTAAGLKYQAESVLMPPGFAKVPRKDVLDLFRGVLVKETSGRVTESKEATSGTLAGVEYAIEAGTTVTRARIYASGSRVYVVQVTGTADQVAGTEAEVILSTYRLPGDAAKNPADTAVAPMPKGPTEVAGPRMKDPVMLGHPGAPAFKDLAPAGGHLVGLEIGLGKFGPSDVVHALRPIYRAGGRETTGEQRGTNLTRVTVAKAKDGYAVGAVTVKAGLGLDGMSVTFMKIVDGKLDPKDAYESEWVGGKGGRAPVTLGGDGTPVVGIVGRVAGDTVGFALLHRGQEAFDPRKEPTVIAGGNAPLFSDPAPAGGVLIGLELGLGKFGPDDVIQAGRPIYRVAGKEQFGTQRGTNLARVVTLKARDGYAVGALTCKSGLNFDGCSLTFMKVRADGTLDPKDSYESEWAGYSGNKFPIKLGGDGTPAAGVVGRATDKQLHGFGLLFKGQEPFDPAGTLKP